MELGRIPSIQQSQVDNVKKLNEVQEVEQDKVREDDEYKNAKPNEIIEETNEVILDNIKFGFNRKSEDFFIKVTRGDSIHKYPTEDMMKLKAQLLQEIRQTQKNN